MYAGNLRSTPFVFEHKPREWLVEFGFEITAVYSRYALKINGTKFEDMPEAPARERAALARSAI